MAVRRIYAHLFVRYQQQSGLDFYNLAFVVIFIISNSIRLAKGTRAGQLDTVQTSGDNPFQKSGYKRIDLGADFLTGMQFNRFFLTVNYNNGLMNILNYDRGIQTTKNRSFAFTIDYFISEVKNNL
jgi:hypothetical protein